MQKSQFDTGTNLTPGPFAILTMFDWLPVVPMDSSQLNDLLRSMHTVYVQGIILHYIEV